VPRDEADQDAGVAQPDDQRGIGRGVHRRHLDATGQPGRRAAQRAGGDDQPRGRQAHQLGGPRVAAHHPGGEAVRRGRQPDGGQHAQHDAEHQAPVHVVEPVAADGADAQLIGQRQRGRFVQAGRIAQRALDPVLEQGNGQVAQQQAGDGFVDAAPLPQPARQRDPHRAGQGGGQQQHRRARAARRQRQGIRQRGSGQAAQHQRAFAADDGEPGARRQRHAQRRQHQRRGALQRVLDRE
jgi:hypothetical protein